ncbi:nucleotide exchange factor GrpE [Streptomyces pristinaespiralis]|uniref:Protein GrpE n=1 Tax=Streptomyces pristinaespiralis TaxID=38300 RepID=A0A0M4DKZ7_STRPR|nr:nucleotide exchange factor GrpE [Streptomyces pristinaespiralis]ALC24510.1 co-chaperone GrpE [Streptomyces pristinaespiralis]QMU13150.1 nucleotide exchange factor GrpE [Streptomyces pristinaespiralis]
MSVPNDRRTHRKEQRPPVIIRDRRRSDPVTLELRGTTEEAGPGPAANTDAAVTVRSGADARPDAHRQPDSAEPTAHPGPEREQGQAVGAGEAAPEIAQLRSRLSERTADLQRTKAEYDNYRKRVRRDRRAVQQIAVSNVLGALLPVLDTVVRAREHGETSKGFTSVADLLEEQLAALGLQSVGEVGEPFDPTAHEALDYTESEEQERPVCSAVLRPGYRVGDHLLRPAQVVVTGPPVAGAGGADADAGTGVDGGAAVGDGATVAGERDTRRDGLRGGPGTGGDRGSPSAG